MTGQGATLETPRLLLRPLDVRDAPRVETLAGDRAVADTTLRVPHPYPAGAARAWIEGLAGPGTSGAAVFGIVPHDEREIVGVIGLEVTAAHDHGELGFWIGVPFWGRGFATEAARVVVTWGFDALGLHRIHAHHFARNPASGRVLERIGMRREGVLREHVRKWDAHEDVTLYGVLAREWGESRD